MRPSILMFIFSQKIKKFVFFLVLSMIINKNFLFTHQNKLCDGEFDFLANKKMNSNEFFIFL